MEFILEKLLSGENLFYVEIDSQKRKAKIIQIDLERNCVFVELDIPIKRVITEYVPAMFSMYEDETVPQDKEVLIHREWVYIK